MSETQRHETVFCKDFCDLPENLAEFIEIITNAMKDIPAEYRPAAEVEFETGFEEYGGEFSISYTRPETKEEAAAYEEVCRRRKERDRAVARTQYEKLKAIFEPPE